MKTTDTVHKCSAAAGGPGLGGAVNHPLSPAQPKAPRVHRGLISRIQTDLIPTEIEKEGEPVNTAYGEKAHWHDTARIDSGDLGSHEDEDKKSPKCDVVGVV